MSYVISNGSVGNALLFLTNKRYGNPFSSDPEKALIIDELEIAARIAQSSYVSYRFSSLDEQDKKSQVGRIIWDARILDKSVSMVNTVTQKTIQETVGEKAKIMEVKGLNPYEAESLDALFLELDGTHRPSSVIKP